VSPDEDLVRTCVAEEFDNGASTMAAIICY
jgi:hypothetical protein